MQIGWPAAVLAIAVGRLNAAVAANRRLRVWSIRAWSALRPYVITLCWVCLLPGCGGERESRGSPFDGEPPTGTLSDASTPPAGERVDGPVGVTRDAGLFGDAAPVPSYDSGDQIDPPEPECTFSTNCQRYCRALATAGGCGWGDELSCICTCEQRLMDGCSGELDALLACAADVPALSCGEGSRLFLGCESASDQLAICEAQVDGTLPDAGLGVCHDFCEGALAAGCAGGPTSIVNCLNTCLTNLEGRCAAQYQAMLSCFAQPGDTLVCDGEVLALQAQCSGVWQALVSCFSR